MSAAPLRIICVKTSSSPRGGVLDAGRTPPTTSGTIGSRNRTASWRSVRVRHKARAIIEQCTVSGRRVDYDWGVGAQNEFLARRVDTGPHHRKRWSRAAGIRLPGAHGFIGPRRVAPKAHKSWPVNVRRPQDIGDLRHLAERAVFSSGSACCNLRRHRSTARRRRSR